MSNLVKNIVNSKDKEHVLWMLNDMKPSDTRLMLWLIVNTRSNLNKLAYIDAKVMRRWNTNYFHELITYAYEGIEDKNEWDWGFNYPTKRKNSNGNKK